MNNKEECYSKIDLMKYLIDEYKEGKADEQVNNKTKEFC